MMKRICAWLLLLFAAALVANAQTTCSTTLPCVPLTWTAPGMSATVTTNADGTQATGPGWKILWSCSGGPTGCSTSSLATLISAQSAQILGKPLTQSLLCPPPNASPWLCSTGILTSTAGTWSDAEQYGNLMNYAVQDAWAPNASNVNGGVSGVTPIYTFQFPQAPATSKAPSSPSGLGNPTGKVITSGPIG